jgi:very-short-patch-repair endonuclease
MAGKSPTRDELIAGLAGRQYGIVTRDQLRGEGLSADVVDLAIAAGRLHPLFRGVFAVGHKALPRESWWMAALLACGDSSALSHHAGGAVWGFRHPPTLPVHVTTPSDRGRKQRNLVVHRSHLGPTDVIRINNLRVTTPARTIVDLAATLGPRAMRETVERAQDGRRFHREEIARIATGRPGTKKLRELIALMSPDKDNARSHLERVFLKLIRKARLPRPEVNLPIAGNRRDFVWPAARLAIEVDGYAYHSSKEDQLRDRRRDRRLTVLGWRPARFTYEEVAFEPALVATELAALLVS